METLDDTEWDIVITVDEGSALSRSGKRILHIDRNDYYGESEAAFNPQEAAKWVTAPDHTSPDTPPDASKPRLAAPRSYNISLSSKLIFLRSNLLTALVSSKLYEQLSFLAVGNWWIYTPETPSTASEGTPNPASSSILRKIPSSREDVFQDRSLPPRATRSLMQFLQFAADAESHASVLKDWGQTPFPEFLFVQYKLESDLQAPLLALTLSLNPPLETTTAQALPQIHRHLTSIGRFGPGFGAVVPMWGGLAEVAQVACRAQAVGGGVYALKKEMQEIPVVGASRRQAAAENVDDNFDDNNDSQLITLYLNGPERVSSKKIVLSSFFRQATSPTKSIHHLIAIVTPSLFSLFPPPSDISHPPAGVVVVFPSGSLTAAEPSTPPIYFTVHSSDTGECPWDQTKVNAADKITIWTTAIIHAQMSHSSQSTASQILRLALKTLLRSVDQEPKPDILWIMSYTSHHEDMQAEAGAEVGSVRRKGGPVLYLKPQPPGLAFEDSVLDDVRSVWEHITEDDVERGEFMQFGDREAAMGEDEPDE
ncbi:MAG: hypothetical protein Q9167_004397 [Letrouitia subvulpina]